MYKIITTGGTVTTSGNYTIVTFNASGTFTIQAVPIYGFYDLNAKSQTGIISIPCDILLVGGGGGGGGNDNSGWIGGGGGAGGLLFRLGFQITPGVYPVTIGTGGAAGANGTYPANTSGSYGRKLCLNH